MKEICEALMDVLKWAQSCCPCENEMPKICPLCGADVDRPGDACKAVGAVFPVGLLAKIRAALKLAEDEL